MKLWLLRPAEGWDPWYDKAFGFVVRAETEADARKLVAPRAGQEGEHVWLNYNLTTCVELTQNGPAEIVIRDFAAA